MKKISKLPRIESNSDIQTKPRSVILLQMASVITTVITLSGCSALNIGSDEYGCKGMPDGVQCMSTTDVYEATNNGNVPRTLTEDGKIDVSDSTLSPAVPNSQSTESRYVAPVIPDKPVPIRTPAQVMRIWIAPWEDLNGDLIVTGYVYTEIEPRRWIYDEVSTRPTSVLRPLQSVQNSKSDESK